MAPLPPRPKSETIDGSVQKSTAPTQKDTYLSERTLLEQQAGKEALARSRQQFNEEQEAGRRSVELNAQRTNQK